MALNPAFQSQGTRTLPLAFGYVQGTGDRVLDYTAPDGSLYWLYLLGEGEWDGVEQYSIGKFQHLYSAGKVAGNPLLGPTVWDQALHFHSGAYTPVGLPAGASSVGPDQAYDPWFSAFPTVTPPQAFSGIAYYMVAGGPSVLRTGPELGPVPPGATALPYVEPPSSPVAVWRTTRCRQFDDAGNVVGYGFTTNPTWHFLEATLRYKIKPQQPSIAGLTDAERACFHWPSIVDHAARNEAVQPNGLPRFVGSYLFAANATLTAIQELILRCCRSFQRLSGGRRIELVGDDPRSAVFFFGANHLVPGSLSIAKRNVAKSANVFVPKYRDLEIPAIAAVTTAVAGTARSPQPYSGGGNAITTLTLNSNNPFGTLALVSYGGGADPTLNGQYFAGNEDLDSNAHFIPLPDNVLRLQAHAAGVASGDQTTGGFIGTQDSRFSERAPVTVQHRAHQRAVGQGAPGLAPQPRLVPVEYDCGNSTYDQTNRLMKFERDRNLGPDPAPNSGTPWRAPFEGSVTGFLEAVDAGGNALVGVEAGDVVNLDDWVTPEFAGDYEVMDLEVTGPANDGAGAAAALGTVKLNLLEVVSSAYADVSDPPGDSYATVPGAELTFGTTHALDTNRPNTAWVLRSTLTVTGSGSTVSVAIPDLQLQLLGHAAPTAYPGFHVTGLTADQPYVLYLDDPTGTGVATFGFAAGSLPLATYPAGRYIVYAGTITLPGAQ